jgi:ADP-ribosyl-[dinitrogen reductase] hydrolase
VSTIRQTISRRDRLAGGLIGLLVGDALGVPYEFTLPAEVPEAQDIEFEPPTGFLRSHAGTPPGTWSDDGAQALCLLASVLYNDRLDVEDFGRRLVNWNDHGYMTPDGRVFDVGIQTSRALQVIRSGRPAATAGGASEGDNGNGSLMRVLPLALWHEGNDEQLVRDAFLQSLPTHGHVRSQVCCAIYVLWARRLLDGQEVEAAWLDAVRTTRAHVADSPEAVEQLEFHVRPDGDATGRGTGYVVDALRSARQVQSAGDYEAIVRAAIRLGNDTDTTACLAGGIAGIRFGLAGIPARWREGLQGRDVVEPLLDQLLASRVCGGPGDQST